MNKPKPAFYRSFTDVQWFGIFFVAAIALWTISLGNVPLRDWDEASHAIVARELYRTGNWLHLTFFGQPYLLKPPLGYWIVASSYHLLGGVSELTTRLPVAILTACGVPFLYLLGREIFPRRFPAILSAAVYLTLLPVVRHGRLMMLDGIINTFFILLLFCLLKARKQTPWAIGIGLCLGLIALTKGILVFALWAIAGLFILCDRQWSIFKNPYTGFGLILGLGMVLSWYYAQWAKYGDLFLEVHLGTQNFDRLATAVEGNDGPPWYYLVELLKYSFPWLLFLPGGFFLAWRKNTIFSRQERGFQSSVGTFHETSVQSSVREQRSRGDTETGRRGDGETFSKTRRRGDGETRREESRGIGEAREGSGAMLAPKNRDIPHNLGSWANLVLVGAIVFFSTISLMGTKLPWYIMPLYPFVALAVGAKLAQMGTQKKSYSRFLVGFFGFAAIAGIGGCIYFILADPQPVLILMGGVVALTMGLVAWQLWQQNPQFIPVLVAGTYASLGLLMLSTSWNWELNEQFPVVKVGELIRENTPAGTVVYTSFAYNRPSLDFYSDRSVNPADIVTLRQRWQEQHPLLIDRATLDALQIPQTASVGTADDFILLRPGE